MLLRDAKELGLGKRPKIFVNMTRHTSTELTASDRLRHLALRLGINRDKSLVETGVYSVGNPSKNSPVFVSANYTMSFDKLRSSLKGMDAWIMVIDTKGINVWCAAGKGTFGTEEIIKCISGFKLSNVVAHKNIIVPQLGAPGTASFEVKKATGFNVIYGPVKSEDIPVFVKAGFKATKEMRSISFGLWDRIVLIPVELTQILKYIIPISIILYFISTQILYAFLLSIASGIIITPVLLPYIPFRSFILKGWLVGFLVELIFIHQIGAVLLFSSVSSYLAFNFTGCTTFTSPSGVKKEMEKYIIPLICTGIGGLLLCVIFI